jgi:1,4-dihydroxy-2-naphthoate octaprenyltransferase
MQGIKVWFLETRPQFLTLTVVLAFLGSAIAGYDGVANVSYACLAGAGLLLAHISVNTLNDYFDYRSGIDLAARRTPFSGGSGILPAGLLKPRQVLWLGLSALLLAVPIGIYFTVVQGWELLPLLLVAAFFILLYSPYILRRPWPEWAAGAGMGALPVLGMYFAQAGNYTWELVVAAVPSGLLVHNLLLLNEFPDADADKQAGRMTLVITMGKRRTAFFYAAVTLLVYLWIAGWVAGGVMPVWALLGLLTLPLAARAVQGAFQHDDPARLVSGMTANVMVVLLTQLFIGIGYIIAGAVS